VLDTLAVVMKSYLPLGHTMKIDKLGVFSLSLEFADNETETDGQQEAKETGSKAKYHHVKAKGVNFKVDKKLVDEINRENTFERTSSSSNPSSPSPYSREERLQRALQHIDNYGFISLQEYASLNKLNYSTASRELAKLVADPSSGLKAKGSASHKVWVRS
jgi:ribosomal protein S25